MKHILIIGLLLCSSLSYGQTLFPYNSFRCGTWVAQSEYYTPWETVDTLGDRAKADVDSTRFWVYDIEHSALNMESTDLLNRACGDDPTHKTFQWRLCAITGIRQRRYHIFPFTYIEHQRTEYERTEDSLHAITDSRALKEIFNSGADTSLISGVLLNGQTVYGVISSQAIFGQAIFDTLNTVTCFKCVPVQVCRNISDIRKTGWTAQPWPAILWRKADGTYLDHKKHPLKPWIRVWEN